MHELDLICIGRAAVDFYSQQIGSRLEDVSSFSKYLGGSAANIAFGASRLGLRSAMLSRVGDEQMGQFVRETLQNEGVNTEHLLTDPDRLTGLAILAIKDRDSFPLLFYRRDCADMAISEADISEDFIASSKALLVQGTHLSTSNTRAATAKAVNFARKCGSTVFLDIDYRPVLWGLTRAGEGDNRYVSSEETTSALQEILPNVDYIVGTEEEIHIAGGSSETLKALQNIRSVSAGTIVLKLGEQGCTIFDGEIPASDDEFIVRSGYTVNVCNVLGAGDAFMAGFIYGWTQDQGDEICAKFANACGALVVSRHSCSSAIPSIEELEFYLRHGQSNLVPDQDPKIAYLHRIANRSGVNRKNLCVFAFDHRTQLADLAAEVGQSSQRIVDLKRHLFDAALTVAQENNAVASFGVLADGEYAQNILNSATGRDLWIGRPIEVPGSRPLELVGGRSVGTTLKQWPVEQVVKCLTTYDPDDATELRNAQERQITELYWACAESGHELLLEIIPPPSTQDRPGAVERSVDRFYNLGVFPDYWKLPSLPEESLLAIGQMIDDRAPHCRGILTLGLAQSMDSLVTSFATAAKFEICIGFAVGRTIFAEPARAWMAGEIDDQILIEQVANNYRRLVNAWCDSRNSHRLLKQ